VAGILSFPHWTGSKRFPDAETLCQRAATEGRILFVPGRFYQRPDRLRISIGGSEEATARALEAFDRFLAGAP
jgi:aspartate/methionine/tyrosine aminotransferase